MNRVCLLLCLLAATVSACDDDGPLCIEVERTEVTEPEDPVFGGSSYQSSTFGEVLEGVVGERSGPLRWQRSDAYVRGFPPPSETRITVTIHEPVSAVYVNTERRKPAPPPALNERLLCSEWLETELEIDLRTDDGMLDASIRIPVAFHGPGGLGTYSNITDVDLGGLTFDPIDPDAELRLRVQYGSDDGPLGTLVLSASSSDDSGNGAGYTVDLATWTLSEPSPSRG